MSLMGKKDDVVTRCSMIKASISKRQCRLTKNSPTDWWAAISQEMVCGLCVSVL